MFQSYSQEKLLREYLDYTPEDPLDYSEFEYDKSEWDNIPMIIPRFTVFISKNLESLSQKCKEKFNEETTESLRFDIEGQILDLMSKFEETEARLIAKETHVGKIV